MFSSSFVGTMLMNHLMQRNIAQADCRPGSVVLLRENELGQQHRQQQQSRWRTLRQNRRARGSMRVPEEDEVEENSKQPTTTATTTRSMESNDNRMLMLMDREGHLEEFKVYWTEYHLEESSELILAELELNRACIQYLIQQTTRTTPPKQRQDDTEEDNPSSSSFSSSYNNNTNNNNKKMNITKLILNSCRYNSTDGTAQYLVQEVLQKSLSQSLQWVRLESAYVGHLPDHTASTLLNGLPGIPQLTTVQLVDIDLRPCTVADKLHKLLLLSSSSSSSSLTEQQGGSRKGGGGNSSGVYKKNRLENLQTLELRHCRVDGALLSRMGQVLFRPMQMERSSSTGSSSSTSTNNHCSTSSTTRTTTLQSLTMHACGLDDDLLTIFCGEFCLDPKSGPVTTSCTATTESNTNSNNHKTQPHVHGGSGTARLSSFRHLSLPSNRLTAASLKTLTNLLLSVTTTSDGYHTILPPALESLDLQRMSRLFVRQPAPATTRSRHDDPSVDSPNHNRVLTIPTSNHQFVFQESVQNFCHAIQTHAFLQTLNLTSCGVTDEIAYCLFRALAVGPVTTTAAATTRGGTPHNHKGKHKSTTTKPDHPLVSVPRLEELWLGGSKNELSATAAWVSYLPHLRLRHLDLPKLPVDNTNSSVTNTTQEAAQDERRQSDGWYFHSVGVQQQPGEENTNACSPPLPEQDHACHVWTGEPHSSSRSDTQQQPPFEPTLFWLCMQRNASLQLLSHDGIPSTVAHSILQRNTLLQQAQTMLLLGSSSSSAAAAALSSNTSLLLLPHVLHRCNESEGSSARFLVLREIWCAGQRVDHFKIGTK